MEPNLNHSSFSGKALPWLPRFVYVIVYVQIPSLTKIPGIEKTDFRLTGTTHVQNVVSI